MRKLITMISSEGKTPKELADEAYKAYQKYNKMQEENLRKQEDKKNPSK